MRLLLLLAVALAGILCTPRATARVEVVFFYEEGCPKCEALSLVLEDLQNEYSFQLTSYDVATVEGYSLFREYGFTTTPALVINGKKLEGTIERSHIVGALQGDAFAGFVIVFILGILSGFSPALVRVHSDVIAEIARTTRQEMDVILRSFVFYAGILAVALVLFLAFSFTHAYTSFLIPLLGFSVSVNALNSALHSFNSSTKVDPYIKKRFMTFHFPSLLHLGFIYGVGKFADSLPFLVPSLFFVSGVASADAVFFLLFLSGVVVAYVVILGLAIAGLNLFGRLKGEKADQIYFSVCGVAVMVFSLFMAVERTAFTLMQGVIMVVIIIITGVVIGFRRRLV